MDRDIPIYNRVVVQKIQKNNHQKHYQRLNHIKKGIFNRNLSNHQSYSLSKQKTIMKQSQKKNQISKNNSILFQKINHIMKRNPSLHKPVTPNIYKNNKTISLSQKVCLQNKKMVSRIQGQKPTINNKKLREQRLKNIKRLKFLGKYPNRQISKESGEIVKILYEKKSRRKSSLQKRNKFLINEQNGNNSSIFDKRSIQNRKALTQKKKRKQIDQYKTNQIMDIRNKYPQILLFQNEVKINNNLAFIKFYRQKNCYRIITQFKRKVQNKSIYQLIIPQIEGNQFFSYYNYNYQYIANMLIIQDGNLVVHIDNYNDDNRLNQQKQYYGNMVQRKNKKIINIQEWDNYEEDLSQFIQ